MTESAVQSAVGVGADRAGAARAFVALMYHNITPEPGKHAALSPAATAYFVSSDAFASQLDILAECRIPLMAPHELDGFYGSVGEGVPEGVAPHHVLLTFDDGWSDCVDAGEGLLGRHGGRALLFVTTDFLDRPHFLSRGGLARVNPDVFCIGSHARTHRMLSLLGEEEIRAELLDSRKILEDIVGRAVNSVSIPNGAVDGRVRRIAAECGYGFVFDSRVRMNRRGGDRLAIGRVAIKEGTTLGQYRRFVCGQLGGERLRRTVLEAPKRILGLRRYDQLRRRLLGEDRVREAGREEGK